MKKRIRGRWFNIFQLQQQPLLVESYAPESALFKRSVNYYNHPNILTPKEQKGAHKNRLVFSLPENAMRMIHLQQEHFNRELGEKCGRLLVEYLKTSPRVAEQQPAYLYLDIVNKNNNSELINKILAESPLLKEMIYQAIESVETSQQVSLHGRLTVGSWLYNSQSGIVYMMSGKTKFMGPIEYDLACTLQNTLEIISHARLTGQPDTALIDFCSAYLAAINEHFNTSDELFVQLLLYFYVGHLNTYQIVQQRYGKPGLAEDKVRKKLTLYWQAVKDILPGKYI